MSFADIPDNQLLLEEQVLGLIGKALHLKKPFSLVRIGDGENIVLAQYNFLSEKEFINSYWYRDGQRTGRGKGATLPSRILRDQMVKAIRQADLVGVCRHNQKLGAAPLSFCRTLTNKIFDDYGLNPEKLCPVWVNRKLVSHEVFWKMLHRYRTLLISKWAKPYAALIKKQYSKLKPNITGYIDFSHYRQIPAVIKNIGKYRFDLALISAGVNSVILAPEIARIYGKVALDFGKTMMFTIRQPRKLVKPWKPS